MRILVLAPHPYYLVRGTPIDLDLVLRVLSQRPGTEVDVVVYAEGEQRTYPGVKLHRTPGLFFLRNTPPGFSLKKLICDFFLAWKALRLALRRRPNLVHAGEEAVFVAMLLRWFLRIPFVYDLDSSIAQQMVEKHGFLRPLAGLFNRCEAAAIRRALVTFPVCNALADLCRARGARKVVTLHDISQLQNPGLPQTGSLKKDLAIDGLVLLYVGNLEKYQGIDLLLEGFARATAGAAEVNLVIVGGSDPDIERYQDRASELGIGDRVHFLGPRPLSDLEELLAEADILTAPRTKGLNTPMKVFPYLHSGRAVLVTDLPTHTQILTSDVAMLAEPTPKGFAEALELLAGNPDLRDRLARRALAFVEEGHTFAAYKRRLDGAYDWIESELASIRANDTRDQS